jgi:hypothetical protein
MTNPEQWHKDQQKAIANARVESEKNKEEREEILNSYAWIKVPRYYEVDPSREDVDWKAEYQKLMEHHKEETTFLIDKVREIIKR